MKSARVFLRNNKDQAKHLFHKKAESFSFRKGLIYNEWHKAWLKSMNMFTLSKNLNLI
jgi:hypothetical protein